MCHTSLRYALLRNCNHIGLSSDELLVVGLSRLFNLAAIHLKIKTKAALLIHPASNTYVDCNT